MKSQVLSAFSLSPFFPLQRTPSFAPSFLSFVLSHLNTHTLSLLPFEAPPRGSYVRHLMHMYVRMCGSMYVYVCMYMYVRMYVYMYVCMMYVCMYVCVCMYVHQFPS